MAQYLEFALNHPYLISGFVFTAAMLIYLEVQQRTRPFKDVSPAQAVHLQNREDAIFVDLRDASEFRQGHVIDAKNLPLKELAERGVKELQKYLDKPLVVYCASGLQSGKACSQLHKAGFHSIHNLSGGLQAWDKAGLPLETKK